MLKICHLISYRADPLSNMVLTFSTKEDAIAFAEKNGMYYTYWVWGIQLSIGNLDLKVLTTEKVQGKVSSVYSTKMVGH